MIVICTYLVGYSFIGTIGKCVRSKCSKFPKTSITPYRICAAKLMGTHKNIEINFYNHSDTNLMFLWQMKLLISRNSYIFYCLMHKYSLLLHTSFHFWEFSVKLLTFCIAMHSNSLPLLINSTPKTLLTIKPIFTNLQYCTDLQGWIRECAHHREGITTWNQL